VRFILGIPLVLFFPGLRALIAVIPGDKGITTTQRIGLSCVLSVAVVGLTGLILNLTPLGVRPLAGIIDRRGFHLVGFAGGDHTAARHNRPGFPADTTNRITDQMEDQQGVVRAHRTDNRLPCRVRLLYSEPPS